jgi:hypothetical protein
MGESVKPTDLELKAGARALEDSPASIVSPDLKDPRVALSFLEADQLVAAKQRTHFGRRNLSLGVRVLLWGLRIYVVVMLVLVVVSALRALRLTP